MEGGITQDNHPSVDLSNQPLKRVIRRLRRRAVPPYHQAVLVYQQTEFAPDNPAVVEEAFAADLLRATAFTYRMNDLMPYVSMTPSTVGAAKKACVQA